MKKKDRKASKNIKKHKKKKKEKKRHVLVSFVLTYEINIQKMSLLCIL
jgi:hypothetical protein